MYVQLGRSKGNPKKKMTYILPRITIKTSKNSKANKNICFYASFCVCWPNWIYIPHFPTSFRCYPNRKHRCKTNSLAAMMIISRTRTVKNQLRTLKTLFSCFVPFHHTNQLNTHTRYNHHLQPNIHSSSEFSSAAVRSTLVIPCHHSRKNLDRCQQPFSCNFPCVYKYGPRRRHCRRHRPDPNLWILAFVALSTLLCLRRVVPILKLSTQFSRPLACHYHAYKNTMDHPDSSPPNDQP